MKKRKSVLIFSLAFMVFFLSLFQTPKVSLGQPQFSNETLTFESKFSMLESSDENGEKLNANSINITMPSSTWNVTQLEINFTSIKMGSELNEVETEETDSKLLDKGNNALAVQINITEPTTIFSVEIYGILSVADNDPLTVEIKGYGDGVDLNAPNNTVYGSTELNISNSFGWYTQTFQNPVNLTEGYYYLVINGTNISISEKSKYWFNYNDGSIENPYLYSYYYDGDWNEFGQGKVFLYKINQRLNRSYTPQEDINLGVLFNNTVYNVTKGSTPYTGDITVPLKDYSPGTPELYLPIIHNLTIIELLVNYTYKLNQKNFLISSGSALVKEPVDNLWSVTPSIVRTDGNYTVEFDYPATWKNLNVFKGSQNITDNLNVTITGDKLIIANDIISQEESWNITAYSPNLYFDTTVPTTSYAPSQTIKLTATPPISGGNFTYLLADPFGLEEHREVFEDPLIDTWFEYPLPANPLGQWNVYILWNNQTDAGIQVIPVQVNVAASNGGGGGGGTTVVTGIDPQLIFMVILYVAIASLAGLSSYKMVKRHKKNKAEHREKVFNKYMDLLNLDYIMIIDKKSGLSVYDQILAGKERDSSLISGFLEAIRTFGIDLTGSEEESQTISLQYQNMNVIMNDFKNFRILNIMKESPSQDFLDSLRPLSHDIDTFYGKSLKDFDGNVAKFRGVKDLLETHLYTSLIYPLKVIKSKEVKLDSAEKSLMNKAQSMMKKNKTEHFYVSHLMGTSKEFNVKNAEIILKLIEKKVFRPIE